MIKKIIIIISIISLFFCSNDEILLLMNNGSNWELLSQNKDMKIYQNDNENFPIIKIERELTLEYSMHEIFNIIKNVANYNNVLTDRNLYSEFVKTSVDTVYGYQKTYNYIPFTRNRHLIFKLYEKNEYKLEWKIINKNNILYENFKHKRSKELLLGAGSWEWINLADKSLFVHYLYIDPEIKLPKFILRGVLKNSVIRVMDDVLNYYNKIKQGK